MLGSEDRRGEAGGRDGCFGFRRPPHPHRSGLRGEMATVHNPWGALPGSSGALTLVGGTRYDLQEERWSLSPKVTVFSRGLHA